MEKFREPKVLIPFSEREGHTLKKIFRMMRFTLFCFLFSLIQVMALDTYSQQTRISLNQHGQRLEDVLKTIEDKSEFFFLYNRDLINVDQSVNIDATNQTIKVILDDLLKGTDISYTIVNRQIILSNIEGVSGLNSQQQKSITGKVTDSSGEPLPGVTVVIKGSTSGTITDVNGNYLLPNASKESVLQFSFVGMRSQEITVGDKKNINVVLETDAIGIDEVVAVGYGTSKKVNLTGSISSVSDKDLKSVTTMNITDNLAGKLPGLRVMQRTSEPGEYSSNFDIRGWGTPLIIVDGIQRGNAAKIDPNEIESVTVLKDASAAIYGVKAANGVILITTKKGKEGHSEISYTGTYGVQDVTSFPRPMNAAEFAEAYNWAQVNSGQIPTYSQEQINDFKSGKVQSTNWWDVAMRNSSPQQQHNLTFTGGTEKVKFFSSLGYFDQEGLFKSGDLNYKRYNLRTNISAQIAKNLEAKLELGGISDKKESPAYWIGGVFKGIWMQKPTLPLYANNNPDYLQNLPDGNNPYAVTNASVIGYNHTYNKTFQGNMELVYSVPFVKGLKASFLYGYDVNHYFNRTFNKQYALYDYDAASQTYIPSLNNSPSNMSEGYSENNQYTTRARLDYEKTIGGKHNIRGLLLYEEIRLANDNFNGNRQFTVDAVDQLYAGNSKQQITSDPNGVSEFDNQGIVGRLNYDYSSKYLFEFSFRNDGSSKFPKGKRWGFFPAFSVGWRLSEEDFIKNNFPFVDNLKIRGSWGKLGDDAAASFQFIPGYKYPTTETFNGYPLNYLFNRGVVTGIGFIGMINPNITWYTATTKNIGLDMSLWNDKLKFQMDVFRRKREGLLDTRLLSLPQTIGASLPQENLNSDLSQGFEVELGTKQKINDIIISVSGQFSYTNNRWLHKEEAEAGNSYLSWRNSQSDRNTNIIWGYQLDGQFQNQDQINGAPIEDGQGNRFVKPGDLKYTDINKDGIIDDWDMVPIAKGNTDMDHQASPEIIYGLNMSLSWRNIDVSALFQGATNFNVRLNEQLTGPFPWGRNGLSQFYDTWHQADNNNPNSEWIPGNYPPARLSGVNPNGLQSPYFVKDASYFRLKNLEVGYSLSHAAIRKIGIEKLRLFANGFNLFTWSKIAYMDPEHPQGQYGYMYPITRNMNFGVNVTF